LTDRPRAGEWLVLALFAGVVTPLFGAVVVWRSAGMAQRHTDFDVYARAAWAARTGRDLYAVTNDDGLHYCYPPPFAVLMAPFAEPAGATGPRAEFAFGVSVATWYALSVAFLFAAAHVLAAAAEGTLPIRPPTGCRRWWALRLLPVLITLPAVGNTLSHGQANLLVLLLVSAAIAAATAGRSGRAGAWLAAAAAVKVFPAFLLLHPLRRLDTRFAAGFIASAAATLFLLPALALGPEAALRANATFAKVMLLPALAEDASASRAEEMFHVLRTDNQSIQAVLHAWRHWGDAAAPAEPDRPTRLVHWSVGALLTWVTLKGKRTDTHLTMAALLVIALFVCPMCHLHYYVLTLPLVTGLLHRWWLDSRRVWPGAQRGGLLVLHVVGGAAPLILEDYRNLGFAPLTTLPLWAAAVRCRRRAA
jgi:uncharacterized membrane protein